MKGSCTEQTTYIFDFETPWTTERGRKREREKEGARLKRERGRKIDNLIEIEIDV